MLGRLFGRQDDAGVATLYKALVDQARRPEFYSDHAVPDTLDGRFDMILLHAFVVLHRFRGEAAEAKDFAQRLFDRMFADMDRNLREIGVGDLSVGHKVKAMGRAFYGRAESYQAGLADPAALAEALRRNLYGSLRDAEVPAGTLAAMAGYLHAAVAGLAGQGIDSLMRGEVRFPEPPPAAA